MQDYARQGTGEGHLYGLRAHTEMPVVSTLQLPLGKFWKQERQFNGSSLQLAQFSC